MGYKFRHSMIDTTETKNALIIFIKNPQLGKVKTRLAKTMSDEKALDIYLELTKITRENSEILRGQSTIQPYVFYSDFIDTMDNWSNDSFEKAVQSGNDLGDRMLNAFNYILQKHTKACIIGSDCPTLSVEILESSFQALENHDFVVGPSTDGGYYLLGMKADTPPQYLFENIAWSTDNVLPDTLKRIAQHQKTVLLLPELTDIDEEKDWMSYLEKQTNA